MKGKVRQLSPFVSIVFWLGVLATHSFAGTHRPLHIAVNVSCSSILDSEMTVLNRFLLTPEQREKIYLKYPDRISSPKTIKFEKLRGKVLKDLKIEDGFLYRAMILTPATVGKILKNGIDPIHTAGGKIYASEQPSVSFLFFAGTNEQVIPTPTHIQDYTESAVSVIFRISVKVSQWKGYDDPNTIVISTDKKIAAEDITQAWVYDPVSNHLVEFLWSRK